MLLETSLVHQHSPADAKIRLFRSLFRGRDDVYPRRFESRKTGDRAMPPRVAMNGFEVSARSHESSARSVSIDSSSH